MALPPEILNEPDPKLLRISDVLPDPDSAPMPVVSSCISWMLPWSVM